MRFVDLTCFLLLQLALVQWKQNFFNHLHNKNAKLAGAVLRMIEKQRNGENIDQTLVKKVVDSFVSLGLDEQDTNEQSLDMYKEHFEIPFITTAEKYYKTKLEAHSAILHMAL